MKVCATTLSPAFRSAFLAGLAAPAGIYAAPAPYLAYVPDYSVAGSFAMVGHYLSQAVAQATPSAAGIAPHAQAAFDF